MIFFENVSKIYSPTSTALKGVTLRIQPKEFVSIVGPSGSGKTTLLKLLTVEERPTEGRIFFDQSEVTMLRPKELPYLRRRIGKVFQDYRLLPTKTAYENVAFALEAAGHLTKEIEHDVPQVLELVGLTEKIHHFPHELSGGELQRVAIARALVNRPEVFLADEPTGNLDPVNTREIIRLLLKINELGATVILATHDKEIIDSLDRRVVALEKGEIIRDEERGKYII
ncbi:MAG: cell division ATP-binding protein FtsE [Candidatus Sungbacteria bacterium]|uniref:Cell division ATP-binding protein FtsE n=1 Tax=Candidatus Sungiibacteriota bacterium TaxID=2750080 RepID=A0A931SBB4_9BACT|nr:cell division ATP-binding protein FtsE [Candidatus Sungbacteria bacterium]